MNDAKIKERLAQRALERDDADMGSPLERIRELERKLADLERKVGNMDKPPEGLR